MIFERSLIVSDEGPEQSNRSFDILAFPLIRSLPVRYPSGGMDLDGLLLTMSVGIGVLPVLMQFALLQ